MIMYMSWLRFAAVCLCLVVFTVFLAVACSASASSPTGLSAGQPVRLYTRTPTPTVTPTPTLYPEFPYHQGLVHRNAWDLNAALERFNTALAIAPSAPYYASRAEVYRLLGRSEDAAADIQEALELDPEQAEAWRQKALLSLSEKAWDEALAAANKLIELKPDDGAAYVLRARIYTEGFGKTPQALIDYRRAISQDAIFDKATLVERWHILAKLGSWEDALFVGQKMATSGSQDPLRYYYRGWPLIQLGQLDEAIQKLIFGIQRYPDYPVALYFALGVAYYERQAWSETVEALGVALGQLGSPAGENVKQILDITEADLLGRMGVAYLELRQCETGAALVERAIAESARLSDWFWARKRIEECYLAITPTPTPTASPIP
jgi:tetratricopeptide (TPR) repeat protein